MNQADVLIVGAGVIGCAIARELAVRGARVELLEARDIALGATQASAGVLAPYIEAHEGGTLLEITVRSLALYDAWIDSVRAESGVDVEYRRSGSLEVATDPESAVRLRAMAGRFAANERLEWLDAAAVRRVEPALSRSALGALSVPNHGYVAAQDLTRALAASAVSQGAAVRRGVRVVRVEAHSDCVEVTSDSGESWRAQRLVVAAGSWSGVLAGLDRGEADVRPVRGQLLRVAWRGEPLTQVMWGPRCYLVPWLDGTLLIGATSEEVGFDERTTAAGVRMLLDAARSLLPEVEEATFLEARAGLRPATPAGLPIIGPAASNDRIVYATGHYRNGILLAPLTARLVGDLIVDGRVDQLLERLGPAALPIR